MPIEILHLITGLDTGGAERMLTHVAARMDRARFRSSVVSMTDHGTMGAVLAGAGVEVLTLGMRRGLPALAGLSRLCRILRRRRPDIVQTWLYHADLLGLIAARLAPVPRLLWNLRCSDMAGLSRPARLIRRALAAASAIPDAVVVNSAAGQRDHAQIGYHPRRWRRIPNGFDTSEMRPDDARRERSRRMLGLAPEAIAIGMAARWHAMKDHGNFLDAAARLATRRPEAVFVLIGPGIDRANAAFSAEVDRRGLSSRVRLLGARDDMALLYPALDIATLTSAWGEGFPNMLGEAMACGVPCVATAVGDAGEVLGDSGILVPPRDPAALAAAWDRLAGLAAEQRRALGVNARQHILAHYDLPVVVAHYEGLYEEAMRG